MFNKITLQIYFEILNLIFNHNLQYQRDENIQVFQIQNLKIFLYIYLQLLVSKRSTQSKSYQNHSAFLTIECLSISKLFVLLKLNLLRLRAGQGTIFRHYCSQAATEEIDTRHQLPSTPAQLSVLPTVDRVSPLGTGSTCFCK